MYTEDLALNNLQGLIYRKTQPKPTILERTKGEWVFGYRNGLDGRSVLKAVHDNIGASI